MQISRHWRMNSQRYRLEGMRFQTGEICLQARSTPPTVEVPHVEVRPEPALAQRAVAIAGR